MMVEYHEMIGGTLTDMAQASATSVDRIPYGLLLARLGREAVARFRCSLRPLELSAQEFFVLKQLQATGPSSQSTLAEVLGIDNSNLASCTAELYQRGLIERARDEADRRRYVVELTSDGRDLLADADRAIEVGEEEMLSALGEDERQQLWGLLGLMAGTLDPQTEAEACVEVAGED